MHTFSKGLRTQLLFMMTALLMGFASTPASAAQKKILAVYNSEDKEFFDLYVEANDFLEAVGLKMYDRSDKNWADFDISTIASGATLKQEGSHKVIVLRSDDFEVDRGGHFILDYLNNGITGKRKEFNIDIEFDGADWQVYHDGQAVSQLNFEVKKVFGKQVGISKIQVVYK